MSWTEAFEPSGWATILDKLNPASDVLTMGDNTDVITGAALAPGILLVVGAIVAFIVLARLCCCEPTRKENRGKSTVPTLIFATLSFVLTGAAFVLFLQTGERGYNIAMSAIEESYEDTSNASALGLRLNATGASLQVDLDRLLTECPNARSLLEPQIKPLQDELATYMELLQTYYAMIQPIPQQLQNLKDGDAAILQDVLLGIFSLPLIFVTANCITMLFAVLGTACCIKAGSCCAKCEDFCVFRLGSIGLAVTILLVSIVSAVELGVGIGLSDFCGDADLNVLTVVNYTCGPDSEWYHENGDTVIKAVDYYIKGSGSNPIMDELNEAAVILKEVDSGMATLEAFSRTLLIRVACPGDVIPPITADINSTLAQATAELAEAQALIQPENIYPYYEKVVYKGACTVVIDGLAWLALFQFLVGILCLPCLACRAASFVHRRTFERARTLENDALLAGGVVLS